MERIIFVFIFILLFCKLSLSQEIEKMKDPQNIEVITYNEAYYPSGELELAKLINSNIVFTNNIEKDIIAKDIMLSFYVMPDSSLRDIILIVGTDVEDIDLQILKLFYKVRYAPSIQNDIEVKSNVVTSLPIRIKKNNN